MPPIASEAGFLFCHQRHHPLGRGPCGEDLSLAGQSPGLAKQAVSASALALCDESSCAPEGPLGR